MLSLPLPRTRCRLLSVVTLIIVPFVTGLSHAATLTAQQVIDRIKQQSGTTWRGPTVDTFKAGDPATPVKGVAVCMMSTLAVLQRAVAEGANLVITHEPTFYGHLDELEPLASENDPVLAAKQEFIRQHGLVIFRFHDNIHAMKPDMIVSGVVKALGWEAQQDPKEQRKFTMAETTVGALAAQIRDRLQIRTLRIVGDPAMKVRRVGFSPGFSGFGSNRRLLQADDIDVLVFGEAHEWETIEYGADAIAAGKNKALIVMGHIPSEEAGMQACAEWMKTFVSEVPVVFVRTPEPFSAPK